MLSFYPLVYTHLRSPAPLGEPLGILLIRHARVAVRARRRRKILALAENIRSYARVRGGFTTASAGQLACA